MYVLCIYGCMCVCMYVCKILFHSLAFICIGLWGSYYRENIINANPLSWVSANNVSVPHHSEHVSTRRRVPCECELCLIMGSFTH